MFPISNDSFDAAVERLSILDVDNATIRQICSLAGELEKEAGQPMVHLEIGNPGLEAEAIGVKAEIEALASGIANQYPPITGIPQLKKAGSNFIKAFLDIDIAPKGIVPTVGSMQAAFTLQLLLSQRVKGKNKMLYLNPGFPAHFTQTRTLDIPSVEFDIYSYRGEALEAKLESVLSKGDISGILYNNPNNPAWTNLTDTELEIIGRLATKYDCIVLEDLAYFGMDFRTDISQPGVPPFGSTVARYTDNYILLLSASKIFSYAGQRIALVCISDKLYCRKFDALKQRYNMPALGDAYIFGILYCASSGTAHSAQFAFAAMLQAATNGDLKFIEHCSEYGRRASIVKPMFTRNGFNIVYDMDGDQPIADGFFFTIGYPGMSGAVLQKELMKYGVSSISLKTTGSVQEGIRGCVSMISSPDDFARLESYLRAFHRDHPF